MKPRVRSSVLVALGVAISACSFELPKGPDLSQLASSYDHPDGELSEDNVEEVLALVQGSLERIEQLSSLDFVVDTLRDVSEEVQEFSRATSESRLRVDLFSETKVPCAGFEEEGLSGEEVGSFVLSLAVEGSELQPTIWGEFRDCRFGRSGVPVRLDSSLQIYVEGDRALRALDIESYLFELSGDIGVGDAEMQSHLDFRVFRDRTLEVRVRTETGFIVAGFESGSDRSTSIRTGDGSFCCHFDERRCARVSGDSCSSGEVGDQEIHW